MAYFTNVNYGRALTTAEQASVDEYMSAQTTAGTTDGNLYGWSVVNSELVGIFRIWSTLESGNGYLALANSFSPPPNSTKIY